MRRGGAGIAGAAFVLGAVLVAAPLYVSSVGSAALQRQFDERCPARISFVLPETSPGGADALRRRAFAALEGARGIDPPQRTTSSPGTLAVAGLDEGVADQVRLLHRSGALDDVEVLAGPDGDGVLVPDGWAAAAGLAPGSTVQLTFGAANDPGGPGSLGPDPAEDAVSLRVAGVYRDLASLLPPRAWCLESPILAPTPNGDPPPPLLILDDATMESLPIALVRDLTVRDVLPVRRSGLTAGVATDLVERFAVATDEVLRAGVGGNGPFLGPVDTGSELEAVATRADGITDLVEANIRPVQVAGALAALTLGLAAGLLAARRRQAELTTRAVRGEGPARLARRIARAATGPAVVGALAGGVVAIVAVRSVGPSDDLGPVVARTLSWAALAAVLTVATTTASAATVVARLADAPPRHRGHRLLRAVPWEWVVVPVVVVAGRRLDHVGGAQFLGNETTDVDALAMAFPMLAATAGAVLLVRPVVLAASRMRRAAPGANPGLVLGLRRIAYDPLAVAAVAGAVTLSVATAALGGALTESARTALAAKARTFVGAESAVALAGSDRSLPESLTGEATVVQEARASSGGRRVVVLGIDPSTFGDGTAIDGIQRRLVGELAEAGVPEEGEPLPAIVVGPLPAGDVTLDAGEVSLDVAPVGRPATFPTSRSSSTLVVVDLAALDAVDARTRAFVLADRDVGELQAELAAADRRVTGAVTVDEITTGTSIAAVDWAYAGLRALGVVVVVVLVGVQLARSAATLRQRQLAEVFTSAMGLGERRAVLAEAVEQGAPLVLGVLVGLVIARVVATASIGDLDSARILPPRSSLVTPWPTLVVVLVVALAAFAVVVLGGRRQARRSRAAVVLRGA